MVMRSRARLFVGVLLLGCVTLHVSAQLLNNAPPAAMTDTEQALMKINDLDELLGKAAAFRDAQDWRRYGYAVSRAVQLRPYSFIFQFEQARAYALQDMKREAYDRLIRMQQQGFSFETAENPDFKNLRGTEVYEYIEKNLKANGVAFGEGKAAFTLDAPAEMIETLAFDPNADVFVAGSIKTGEIFRVSRSGKSTLWIKPDADNGQQAVLSLAVDSKRKSLFVGSGAMPAFTGYQASDFGKSAVLEYDLGSGKLKKRHPIPFDGAVHLPSALAIADDGTVYIADAGTPQIFRLKGGKVDAFVGSPDLGSLRGLALSANGKYLYAADYELGVIGVDIASRQMAQIPADPHNLGGIDGLFAYGENLYAIQNAFPPRRVIRIVTGDAGRSLQGVQPLEANREALSNPTTGVVVGDRLYFFANSQRDQYDGRGRLAQGLTPSKRIVFSTSLKFNDGPITVPKLDTAPAQ